MWVPWFLEVKLSAGLGLLGAWKGAETYGTNQEDSKLQAGLLLATARTIGGSDSALPRACALTKEDGYMDNKLVVCAGAGSRARAGREALPSSVPPCGVQSGPAYCVCSAAQLSPGLRVLCVYRHGRIPYILAVFPAAGCVVDVQALTLSGLCEAGPHPEAEGGHVTSLEHKPLKLRGPHHSHLSGN